ncbi:hypothetical protein [Streptomyces sp. GS7]|uniref:hypothetical protein n=1 Tax=Streptomyces sp. GS7 TaxID=2692234 RepID=UPI0013183F36|nr:hypothetical protein [Streptomyces sp. GS7]QHC23455.1 hypothetical protein GR130_20775 [Streptomyces sp. GS7]
MTDPVFVVHGVANRDPSGFTAAVAALQAASSVEMHPVYWGDLGAQDQHIAATLPPSGAPTDILRAMSGAPHTTADDALAADLFDTRTPSPDALTHVEQTLREHLTATAEDHDDGLRDGDFTPIDSDQVAEYLTEAWDETTWLQCTDDVFLLTEVGRNLARTLLDDVPQDEFGYAELRSSEPTDSQGRLRSLVRRRLSDLDRVAGAAIQAAVGRMNHALRSRFGPGTTRFLGDVLVYQRHQAAIHTRIRASIDAVDPELGRSADRPVRVVAHSLGGVIAVDMATSTSPLWTERLLTFGSQAAFFHVCDPRGGQLEPYSGAQRVALPASLAHWTNLWEPLDVLAFAASNVFQLHDGRSPLDIPVPHSASTGLWTHSAYWDSPEVATVIGRAMRAGSAPTDALIRPDHSQDTDA